MADPFPRDASRRCRTIPCATVSHVPPRRPVYSRRMSTAFEDSTRAAAQAYLDMLAARPKLRGLLHGIAFPVALAAGIVLIALAGTPRARVGCTIYAVSTWLLFGVSALYHRWHGSMRVRAVLRRADHANIFLI